LATDNVIGPDIPIKLTLSTGSKQYSNSVEADSSSPDQQILHRAS